MNRHERMLIVSKFETVRVANITRTSPEFLGSVCDFFGVSVYDKDSALWRIPISGLMHIRDDVFNLDVEEFMDTYPELDSVSDDLVGFISLIVESVIKECKVVDGMALIMWSVF